jgi:hypothetical protein
MKCGMTPPPAVRRGRDSSMTLSSHDQSKAPLTPLMSCKGLDGPRRLQALDDAWGPKVGSRIRLGSEGVAPPLPVLGLTGRNPMASYETIMNNPKFKALVSERSSIAWALSIAMLVIYFGFILLVAYAPKGFLATPLGAGVMTVRHSDRPVRHHFRVHPDRHLRPQGECPFRRPHPSDRRGVQVMKEALHPFRGAA